MRETQGQIEILTSHCGAITDADDGEFFLKAFTDPGHHIVHQGTRGAGHGIGERGFVAGRERQQVALVLDLYLRMYAVGKLTLGAFDVQHTAVDFGLNPFGYIDGIFSNPGHVDYLSGNDAQNFTAQSRFTRGTVGHDTFGRGDDGDAQSANDLG